MSNPLALGAAAPEFSLKNQRDEDLVLATIKVFISHKK